MKRRLTKSIVLAVSAMMVTGNFTACSNSQNVKDSNIELQIMATSDVHNYLMNYDYYTNSEKDNMGLVKISTVIDKYKEESKTKNKSDVDNVLVVDNGDLLQGNPLGDYFSKTSPVKEGEEHPVYKALNGAGYDIGTLGNHEFNFGLDYLKQLLNDSKVSIINANVYNAATNEPEFTQYKIIDKEVVDNKGNKTSIKIGVTGFVPPQILNWDKNNLEGKVTVKDIKESAEEIVPKMKEEGADIVLVLSHSGLGDGVYNVGDEDESYELTTVEGIDAIVAGHSHDTFPRADFSAEGLEGIDLEKGTINGVPLVQPAKYGEGVGLINLSISKDGDSYKVASGNSEFISVKDVENDGELVDALKDDHKSVIDYVNSPVGKSETGINTYFSLVSDSNAVELISEAQLAYGQKKLAEESTLSAYKNLPVLSAAAPFKAGLSEDGIKAADYVDLKAGDLSIKDIANVYKYANTAVMVKVNGKVLKDWLQMSAGLYNTIDSTSSAEQELINLQGRAYNMDVIDGVTYEINVSESPKYDFDGNVINEGSNRITNLMCNGQPVKDEDEFVVVTNNYRAFGGGNYHMLKDAEMIYNSSDETRQIINEYVKGQGTINIKANNNWAITGFGNANITFVSSALGESYLNDNKNITKVESMEKDLAKYKVNSSR